MNIVNRYVSTRDYMSKWIIVSILIMLIIKFILNYKKISFFFFFFYDFTYH
jgi:hypothetical protein